MILKMESKSFANVIVSNPIYYIMYGEVHGRL